MTFLQFGPADMFWWTDSRMVGGAEEWDWFSNVNDASNPLYKLTFASYVCI